MAWAPFGVFPFFVWSLMVFCSFSLAQEQSHYDAARELMETLHEKAGAGFIDTVVNKIVAQKPAMKQHENVIYKHIKRYLNSSAYEETRIKAILHYFTETEIRDIAKIVNNPSFHNATGEQMALIKKYEKVFKRLEKLFIEYIQMKLDKKY